MNQKAIFLIFCMIFVATSVFCQDISKKDNNTALKVVRAGNHFFLPDAFPGLKPSVIHPVAPDFYTTHLGFFCKQEIKFERITNMPFKFRLGSVQYCDWMEGKRSAGILPGR